jgi:hypothetical protein
MQKVFTKVINMKLWCRDLVVQLKVGGSASALKRENLDQGKACFTGGNIHNQSSSLSDITFPYIVLL